MCWLRDAFYSEAQCSSPLCIWNFQELSFGLCCINYIMGCAMNMLLEKSGDNVRINGIVRPSCQGRLWLRPPLSPPWHLTGSLPRQELRGNPPIGRKLTGSWDYFLISSPLLVDCPLILLNIWALLEGISIWSCLVCLRRCHWLLSYSCPCQMVEVHQVVALALRWPQMHLFTM